ncbi:Hypothetical protein I5071_36980 [Sandaracinus amylolyticus]|nr:Hypothetical protein I5071_36980 [Sandaracinus amylolyticus]
MLALSACGHTHREEPDAGMLRDAALAEGGVNPSDAAAVDAGTIGSDASSARDAGGGACGSSACDPRAPSSCGDGDAGVCALVDRVAQCVASIGERRDGEICVSDDECAPMLACFGATTPGEGVCARICCPSDRGACGDQDEVDCRADAVLVTGVPTQWGRCGALRTCDVLAPERDCAPGEGCYIETDPARTVCRWAGEGDVGDPCLEARDCGPGFFCGGVPSRTCVRVCRVDDPTSCPLEEGRCVAQAYSPPGSGVCVASAARM